MKYCCLMFITCAKKILLVLANSRIEMSPRSVPGRKSSVTRTVSNSSPLALWAVEKMISEKRKENRELCSNKHGELKFLCNLQKLISDRKRLVHDCEGNASATTSKHVWAKNWNKQTKNQFPCVWLAFGFAFVSRVNTVNANAGKRSMTSPPSWKPAATEQQYMAIPALCLRYVWTPLAFGLLLHLHVN